MASSIPSMSATNNLPLPLSISSTSLTTARRDNDDESQSLNNSTTKNSRKIKDADDSRQEQLNPMNFSFPVESHAFERAGSESPQRIRKLSVGPSSVMIRPSPRRNSDIQQSNSQIDVNRQEQFPIITRSNNGSFYNLKWDGHASTTVSAVQLLLQNETFVDVTLVCDEEIDDGPSSATADNAAGSMLGRLKNQKNESNNNTILNPQIESDHEEESTDEEDTNELEKRRRDLTPVIPNIKRYTRGKNFSKEDQQSSMTSPAMKTEQSTKFKAHKVILSTCSDYFCRIFSENPCKHPVILLKDFQPWEVRALLDFMYKGQVMVKPERLEALVKAAESLQIRGLKECVEKSPEWKKVRRNSIARVNIEKDSKRHMQEDIEREKRKLLREGTHITTTKICDDTELTKCHSSSAELNNQSKYSKRKPRTTSHKVRSIIKYDDYENEEDSCHTGDESMIVDDGDDEDMVQNGPSSPKLLNLSMSSNYSHPLRHEFHHGQSHYESLRVPSNFLSSRLRHQNSNDNSEETPKPVGPQTADEQPGVDLPHIQNHHQQQLQQQQQHHNQTNPSASPPFPRRKQARPRRRSGDFVAHLRTTSTDMHLTDPYQHFHPFPPNDLMPFQQQQKQQQQHNNNEILDFTIDQNTIAKRNIIPNERSMPQVNNFIANHFMKSWSSSTSSASPPVHSPPHLISSPFKREVDSEDLLLSAAAVDIIHSPPTTPDAPSPANSEHHKNFRSRERLSRRKSHHRVQDPIQPPLLPFGGHAGSPPVNFFLNLSNGQHQHPFNRQQSDPELRKEVDTPPSPPKVGSPVGFPMSFGGNGNGNVGSPAQQWPGLPLGPPPIFGRHRAQHSAPRGGPPRAWSNADLTEALHNVWNKKMTTSQASRIFGIPYNSLLMYVRGKYGKSLKLDLLKKGLDLAMLEKANNNNNGNNNSSSGTSATNRSSTPSSTNNNNNNNNNSGNKSKSHAVNSPPSSLNVNSLMGGDRVQQRDGNFNSNTGSSSKSVNTQDRSRHHNRNDPQDIISPGFNPFSIFGDYHPGFPFSNPAAAAALSHILPPPPPSPGTNHLAMFGAGEKVNNRSSSHRNRNNGSTENFIIKKKVKGR